jgi:toxin ParE1/3/4
MSQRVLIEPEAEADLRDAFIWYEEQRQGLGDDFMLCFEAAVEVIGEHPHFFPRVTANARRMLMPRFPYSIVFVERSELILVLAVFHASRDPKRLRKRVRRRRK